MELLHTILATVGGELRCIENDAPLGFENSFFDWKDTDATSLPISIFE